MIVFAGPSIVGVNIPDEIDLRPPAKQGDIYLATLDSSEPIGLIDGYFEGVPAVWHKEILWALAHGIPVLGASSMGALRAAELDHFGMIGVGRIYEGFRDGLYEDDDEVALHHSPPEVGYAPLSIAMVNIRATIDKAIAGGIISVEQGANMIVGAKSLYYGDRNWKRILQDIPSEIANTLKEWLPENEVDQKQIDAVSLLNRMIKNDVTTPSVAEVSTFDFEHTRLWDNAVQHWQSAATRKGHVSDLHLLDDD